MYTLFYNPGSASFVVHWLLIELGAPHELRLLDFETREQKSPEYLKLNPAGVVPTLLVDGEPLTEAAAIVLHLADAFPDAGLAPPLGTRARAHYYRWLVHLANTVQPLFRNWYYPSEVAGEGNEDAVRLSAQTRLDACWSRIDSHLGSHGPWLLGERMSAADFHLTMLMRWSRNLPRQAMQWPNLARLATAMKQRESFKKLYAIENLSEWA